MQKNCFRLNLKVKVKEKEVAQVDYILSGETPTHDIVKGLCHIERKVVASLAKELIGRIEKNKRMPPFAGHFLSTQAQVRSIVFTVNKVGDTCRFQLN